MTERIGEPEGKKKTFDEEIRALGKSNLELREDLQLKADNNSITLENVHFRKDLAHLQQKKNTLIVRVNNLESEKYALRSDSIQMNTGLGFLREKNGTLTERVGELEKSNRVCDKEIKEFKRSNLELRGDLIKVKADNAKLMVDSAKLTKDNLSIHDMLDRLEKSSKDFWDEFDQRMTEKLAVGKAESEAKSKGLIQHISQLESENLAGENCVENLSTRVHELEEESSSLRDKFNAIFRMFQRLISPTTACICELRDQW